jgi:hypothetical protein
VEAAEPTVYIIHNLLTSTECQTLIQQSANKFSPVDRTDRLQLTVDPSPFVQVDRVMLWQGIMKGPAGKAIDERIEQVTGFPVLHYSDWVVDRLPAGSHWKPHYDVLPGNDVPLATITVFLSDVTSGGEMVYPSTSKQPVKIRPVMGLAIVHHNTNERHEFDENSIHGLLPVTGDDKDAVLYVARKFILPNPVSNARRIGLAIASAPFGGKLPSFLLQLYDVLTRQFGEETGGLYFDKVVVFVPVLLLLILLQFIGQAIHKQMQASGVLADKPKKEANTGTTVKTSKSNKKKN